MYVHLLRTWIKVLITNDMESDDDGGGDGVRVED